MGTSILPLAASRAATAPPRLASLDWSTTELALTLGVVPVAASESSGYRGWVKEPALPAGVSDLGLRQQPNLELLQQLRPDLILTIPDRADIASSLDRIAPSLSLPIYTARFAPYRNACSALTFLGDRTGAADRAAAVLAAVGSRLDALRERLAPLKPRPVTVIRFVDGRTAFVFTAGGLFDDILGRLGLTNGYAAPPSRWGYVQVPLVALAEAHPETRLFYLDSPLPPDALLTMRDDPLWRSLPFTRSGSVAPLPTVWFFGAVAAALRFAEVLTDALLHSEASRAG